MDPVAHLQVKQNVSLIKSCYNRNKKLFLWLRLREMFRAKYSVRNVSNLQFRSSSGMEKSYYRHRISFYCLKLHESLMFSQGKPSLIFSARVEWRTPHGAKPK